MPYGNVRKWLKFMRVIQDERACGFVLTIRGIHDSTRMHAFIQYKAYWHSQWEIRL